MAVVLKDLLIERGVLARQLTTRLSTTMPEGIAAYAPPSQSWGIVQRYGDWLWAAHVCNCSTHIHSHRTPFARRMCLALTMFKRTVQVTTTAQVLTLEHVHPHVLNDDDDGGGDAQYTQKHPVDDQQVTAASPQQMVATAAAPALEQHMEQREYTQLHIATTGLTLQVNRVNFDTMMTFIAGNAQQINPPRQPDTSADDSGHATPNLLHDAAAALAGDAAQQRRRTEFNAGFKFGVPGGSSPEFCLTAHVPRILVMISCGVRGGLWYVNRRLHDLHMSTLVHVHKMHTCPTCTPHTGLPRG